MLSYLQSLVATPANAPSAKPKPKKPHRARSNYTSNKTASLQLPDTINTTKIEPSPKINNVIPPTSFLSPLFALFSTSANTIHNTTDYKKITTSQKEIHLTMTALESQFNKIKNTDEAKADALTLQKVELVAEYIKEHAARRVDLFLYLLIAVRNKQMIISKDHTLKQHGKGSLEKGTHACHSSLFPNLKFEKPASKWSWLFTSAANPTLSATQLLESLNMTIELPTVVNAFDGHLEGRYQQTTYSKTCLALLNKVSNNEIDIKEAMNAFVNSMSDFFDHFENKYIKAKKTIETPEAMKKVWEYEKQGTLQAANLDMQTINDDYLYLMLRLKPADIDKVKKNPKLLSDHFQRIQAEIYDSKSIKIRAGGLRKCAIHQPTTS